MDKKILLENIDKIHTTEMGINRIQSNLEIRSEPVSYCISKLNVKKKIDKYLIKLNYFKQKKSKKKKRLKISLNLFIHIFKSGF